MYLLGFDSSMLRNNVMSDQPRWMFSMD